MSEEHFTDFYAVIDKETKAISLCVSIEDGKRLRFPLGNAIVEKTAQWTHEWVPDNLETLERIYEQTKEK